MRAARDALELLALAFTAALVFAASPPGRRLIEQLTTPICVVSMQ